jgi:hypothetical protein
MRSYKPVYSSHTPCVVDELRADHELGLDRVLAPGRPDDWRTDNTSPDARVAPRLSPHVVQLRSLKRYI